MDCSPLLVDVYITGKKETSTPHGIGVSPIKNMVATSIPLDELKNTVYNILQNLLYAKYNTPECTFYSFCVYPAGIDKIKQVDYDYHLDDGSETFKEFERLKFATGNFDPTRDWRI